jgi:hypothetical protein
MKILEVQNKMISLGLIEPLSVMYFDKSNNKKYYFDKSDLDIKQYNGGMKPDEYGGIIRLSEFNAQLCEWIVEYWSKEGDTIVDPFAGRVTRAAVTTHLNRIYEGYEISPQTYNRSLEHYQKWNIPATLHLGDGRKMDNTKKESADLILTCPPYFNLERYESVEGQISDRFKYSDFLYDIDLTIRNCKRVLKQGGYGCWVVGDFRNFHRWGGLLSFHSDLIKIIKDNGLQHWDTIVIPSNYSPIIHAVLKSAKAKQYTAKKHEYLIVFKKD